MHHTHVEHDVSRKLLFTGLHICPQHILRHKHYEDNSHYHMQRDAEYHYAPGKVTEHKQTKEKEFILRAKLTEKNLQQLENCGKVDGDLGLATPSSVLVSEEVVVKSEVPSLEKLKESHKNNKIS